MGKHYDVMIVGGGICGLVFLKYAVDKKLNVLLIEKESAAGGLWRKIPPWQDIQTPIEDWAINNTPIKGHTQPDILENIMSWIDLYKLGEYLRFDTPLTNARFADGAWVCTTPQETLYAKYLIVATGLHNMPRLPKIEHIDPAVSEIHAAQLFDLATLSVKRLTVVGGGASAFDIIEKALEREVQEIHWVLGTPGWMTPTRQPKHKKKGLRILAETLVRKHTREAVNAKLRAVIHGKYRYFGVEEILPPKELDFWKYPLINGRAHLIANFARLIRHQGHLRAIHRNKVITDHESFETDLVVYATGYDFDLSFLGLEAYRRVTNRADLQKRCGSAVKALDYPNLFFFGPTILDTNSSTPFYAATFAKTIIAHIMGKTAIPDAPMVDNEPHWALIRFLAGFDRYNYPRFFWRIKYFVLAWYYKKHPEKQVWVKW